MFNMTKIRASNASGKSFYANHLSSNDYYSEHEKITGHWRGELADVFGLRDEEVTGDVFSLFQKNINPKTFGRLTQKTVKKGPRFFDFQVAAPKSVSVMSLFDERLASAHQVAAREAMAELEKLAAVRVRDGENVRTNNYETTGKLVYAEFMHDTSRELDPQLHTHHVVCNVTRSHDGKFKALETLEMCRAIRYAGKVYHNALARHCRELGYEIVPAYDRKGNITWFDLKCVSREILERYSKRRKQIEEAEARFVAEHGRKPTLPENNAISNSTRSAKLLNSSRAAVLEYQLGQLSSQEEEALASAVHAAETRGKRAFLLDQERLSHEIRQVMDELFERESVLKRDKLLAEILNRNLGSVDLTELKSALASIQELVHLGGEAANPYYSPREVIERENSAIDSVEDQRGLFEAIAPEFVAFAGDESRKKQAELIYGLLSSKDRFLLFRGVAGSGKTSTLQEFCKGLKSGGIENIVLVAPTNSAADVLKQEGFEQSHTVAAFLLNPRKPPENSYLIIDESGLNSLREGVEILKLARKNNYRVLFVGDARQHTAVESGDFFRLLEDYSQIQKFSLTEIHRQRNEEYRRGIFECAMGQFEEAFERFEQQHFIHEGKQKYLEEAAGKYMEYTEQGRFLNRALLVAPTHEECDKLTVAVREKLKERQAIHSAGREMEVFRSWNKPKAWLKDASNFQPGMTIGFIRNMKGVGKAGEMDEVKSVADGRIRLCSGRCLNLKTAYEFIDVGEKRGIELCAGDLIQFRVNLKEKKIYNGTLARISRKPGYIDLLDAGGKIRRSIPFPEHYAAFDYGWVTTSHKSQGRTAENVVVAAESLDRKAFYVALSRGRNEMSLHCPDKEHLRRSLARRTGERASIHDLIRDREIPPNALLPLSEKIRVQKAKILPDFSYKEIAKRLKRTAAALKRLVSDRATVRKMRQYRERLAVQYHAQEQKKKTENLFGRIVKLFRKSVPAPEVAQEFVPEEIIPAPRNRNAELRKICDCAWREYESKRREYHALFGRGGFELTETEISYLEHQEHLRGLGKAPAQFPDWMANWKTVAEREAKRSLEAHLRKMSEKRWQAAEQELSAMKNMREAWWKSREQKFELPEWKESIQFRKTQEERKFSGLEPLELPDGIANWKDSAEVSYRSLCEAKLRKLKSELEIFVKKGFLEKLPEQLRLTEAEKLLLRCRKAEEEAKRLAEEHALKVLEEERKRDPWTEDQKKEILELARKGAKVPGAYVISRREAEEFIESVIGPKAAAVRREEHRLCDPAVFTGTKEPKKQQAILRFHTAALIAAGKIANQDYAAWKRMPVEEQIRLILAVPKEEREPIIEKALQEQQAREGRQRTRSRRLGPER